MKIFFSFILLFIACGFSVPAQSQSAQTGRVELRLKAKLGGHNKSITSIEFSPDGKVIATVSQDETVRLWDAETGTLKATLSGDETLKWQAEKWGVVKRYKAGGLPTDDLSDETLKKLIYQNFSISPDGKWKITWQENSKKRLSTVTLQDAATDQKVRTFEAIPTYSFHSFYWSPDSSKFLADSNGGADPRLFAVSKENFIAKLPLAGCVVDAMFTDDNCQVFSFNADGSVFVKEKTPLKIWSGEDGSLLAEIKNIKLPLSFSPVDSKTLVTTDKDKKTALLWEMRVK